MTGALTDVADDEFDAFYANKAQAKVPAPASPLAPPALSIGKAPPPTPDDDFDAFYKAKAAGNAGIAAARDANPDKFALADQIGREMGLPATVVERNLPEMEAKKRQSDLVKVLKDNPKLAQWYSQFDNARSVSPEDAANLGMLEQLGNAWGRGMLGLRQQGSGLALGGDARALQNITSVEARLAKGEAPEDIPDIEDTYGVRYMTPDERGALRAQVQRSTGQRVLDVAGREIERNRISIDPTVQAALGAKSWGEFWTHFTEKPLTFIATVGTESLPQMGPTIVAGAIGTLAGGPAGGAALAGAASYGLDYAASVLAAFGDEGIDITNPLALRKAVNDPALMERVGSKAASHATGVAAFDALSGGVASKTLAPTRITSKLGREVTSMAVQAPLQGALGAAGEAVGTVLAGDEVKPGDVAAEFFGEFVGAPAEVASIAGAQGLRGVREVTEQRAAAATAQRNQDIFKALDSSAAGLAMREKLPERTREAVNQILAGGPVDTIYVPAAKVNELFQSLGLGDQYDDPLSWFDSIAPGLGQDYAEALDLGADVAIPLADYYTKIAGTDASTVLVEHLRFHPGEVTAAEAKEFEGDADALFEEALKEAQSAEAQAKVEAGPSDFVFEDVQRRAMDAGIAPDQARQYAALWRAFFRIAGEKYKIDPKALYEKYGVQVRRQIPQGVIETPVDQMDLLIDDLRSSKAPRQKDLVGSSLLEWISRRGGVHDDAGELAAMDAPLWHKGKRGRRMLVRDPAKPKQPGEDFSLDETARAAWEAGYFPELGDQRPDVNTLLEAIRAELSGKARYAQQNVDAAGVERQQMIKDLDEALYTLGIDPATAPNEVIKEALKRAGTASDDGALFQAGRARSEAPAPLGTDPKELAHTVVDILYGDTPAIKANTREVGDIARDLMARGAKALRALGVKGGRIDGPDPKTDEIISRAIATEIKAALDKGSRNAWYTRKVEEALAVAALMHPEIATDPIAAMGFTAALAITSQGETSNVRLADPIYRIFKETGRFPTEVKAKNGPAMGINFAKLNKLLDEQGPEGTRAFLHAQFTVGDLKKAGYPIGGENVGTVVYGSAILGPKIGGGFFQNLNRNYSPVTMDLWFMRAWGRLTGSLVGNPDPASLAKQKDRLTAALEAAGRKAPKTDAALQKQAEDIRLAHEADFRKNRKAYDSGEKVKAEITYAAERYLIGLNGINEQPGSGSERVWMRERVGRAQELLAQEGTTLTAADLQAVWGYPEKDLYAKLGGRDSEAINVDYAGALTDLARSKGIDDDTITRAVGSLDQRSGPTGRTDDGRADDGGGQGNQGSGAGRTLFQAENAGRDARSGDRGPDEPQGLYARGSGGSGGKLLLGDLPAVARWEPTGNGPVLFELEPSPAAAQAFSAAIRASKENNAHGAAVYVYGDEDYAGMRMFLTEDHLAGIALKGDDTVSVFNTRGSPHKKAGVHLVRLAVQLGGRRLDAFDTVLPEIYAQAGFSVAAILPWDESQSPEGWDKAVFERWNNGTPDVVFMAYTGRTGAYEQGEGPYAVDYDDAVRLQKEAIDAHEAGATEREFFQGSDAGRGEGGGGNRAQASAGSLPAEPAASQAQARLEGLPASSPGGVQAIRDAAERYLQARGLPVRRQARFVVADPARGARIATAYADMLHAPQDPAVVAAYRAMIDETLAQYQLIKDMGMVVEVIEPGMPDPYPGGPKEVLDDLHRNHLWLYPTDSGFGTLTEITDNPLLEPTDEFIGDRRLVANDIFRIVHDVFGHGHEGVGFGPSGEENAWQSHVRMYSHDAAGAMTSETRGQNSWVNFGPYGESNRSNQRDTVYADQKVGLMPEWTATEGIEDAPATELFQADAKRGSIQLSPGKTIINLFAQADLSTFLHESGHFFLEVTRDLALRPDAPAEAKADWETLKRELGIPDDGPIPVEAHEKFASGFEAHLMEGKAPSAELAGAFQRFKAWLSYVYKTIQRLGGPVSEPVAQVMNRMLASADEIAQAEATYRYAPAFKTADAAGLTEAEFRAYMATAQRATDNATRELEAKLMAEVRREQEAQWKARRAEIRAEVEAEMSARPVYRALAFLRGKDLDGAVPVAAMRLDREGVVAVIGEAGLKRLPKSVPPVYALNGGVDPALVGDMFGFGSGAEMLEALMAVQPLAPAVEAETAARMHAEFGDLMTAGLAEAAEAAVHSDERALFLATELRALARKSGNNGRAVPAQAARAIAREVIGRTKTGEIRIAVYARAEQRAAKEAEKAILSGDMAAATEAKRKQLLNHMLVVEARKAADTVEAAVKYLSKFRKRSPSGGIDAAYYAQIRELLERHDLRPVSGPQLEKRESLLAFVTAQQALGNPITVPETLLDEAKRQHIKQMTLSEVEGLRDTVKQIAHLGRLKKTLRTAKDKRDFEAGRNAVVDRINDQGPGRPESPNRNPQRWERFTSWVRGIDAGLLKLETIIEWLDGGATGPLHDFVMNRMNDAQGREMDLQVRIAGDLEKAFRRLPKAMRARLKDKVLVPELGGKTYRRDELIAVALNTGNEGNLTKMLEGEAKRGGAWDRDAVFRALFRLLSKEEWDLVQEIWDTIEQLWPETAALEKRLTGVEPVKVERQPVTTPWGVLPGGYYPVVYDPKLDPGAERHQDQAAMFEDFVTRPTTASGHTKERTTVAKPILLDLDVLVRHVNQVIHRITHQEAIMQAHRLLTDAKVRSAIESQMSPEVYRQFVPWLQAIANDKVQEAGLRSWDQLANGIRANATMMGLGYRISTIIAQAVGFSNVAEVVGPVWMLKGIGMTYGNPLKVAEAYRFARGKSAELRHRATTMDRDIRDSLRGLTGQRGAAAQVKRFAFAGIGLMDGFVSTAAWMAGYHKQLKLDPNDDAAAIAAGDRVIRASQGAGGTKDLAAIQRQPGLWKFLTMFYSFFSVLYNRQRDLGRSTVRAVKAGAVSEFPALLARAFFLVVLPSVLGDLLVGKGPDGDDDEGWAEWMAKKAIAYPFLSLPVARDVIGGMTSGFGYQFTPAARGIDTIAKLLDDIRKAFDPDEEVDGVKATKHAIEALGYGFGLPLGQPATTFSQVWEGLENGDLAFRDLFLSKSR